GNVIDPQDLVDQYGAEILRLWVAAEDYTVDIRISDEILKRLVDAYRRIRNTSRYILGNLYDFNPGDDTVPYEKMREMDKAALHRLQDVIRRVRQAYENYQFHVVYYTLHNYCTVDLSALYLDVLKDRIYTSKAESMDRRSAQSAMYIILDTMVKLLAPILTFTAEEIWESLPSYEGKEESVHMTLFPEVNPDYRGKELGGKWQTLVTVKSEVSKAIELARQQKIIGHSLDCSVTIYGPEKLTALLTEYLDDLRALLIVSDITVASEDSIDSPYVSPEIDGLKIGVTKALGEKCERCWHYSTTVGSSADHPTICDRCCSNL
ncbi:MAG: class I tRNA ligase family protein, partial [Deltaproteobacteria bacterium]|nr:class I tRNA ligase family protein [Deltaproteobacteria bacterium]